MCLIVNEAGTDALVNLDLYTCVWQLKQVYIGKYMSDSVHTYSVGTRVCDSVYVYLVDTHVSNSKWSVHRFFGTCVYIHVCLILKTYRCRTIFGQYLSDGIYIYI